MSYEIPQSLQYKEKIAFNLTFEQLIYATVFGLPALFLFAKLPYSRTVRILIALIPVCIGLAFMFLNIWEHFLNIFHWYKFRKADMFDAKMKAYLQLQAVHQASYFLGLQKEKKEKKPNRILLTLTNIAKKWALKIKTWAEAKAIKHFNYRPKPPKPIMTRVGVLRVEPLNFNIKTKDDRDSIIYNFQKFLNALDFPIQIAMYTDDLNLNKYLKSMESKIDKNNKMGQELFSAHKNYLDSIMKDRLAVNRKFYITVKENDLGLDTQLNIVREFLKTMNLKSTRLTGRTLINILIKFFNNPRGRGKLLEKEKTIFNITHPEQIINYSDSIKVNEYYNRIIAAVGYPRTVEEGFLDKIITTAGNFDLSIHIEPFPIDTTLTMLNKELQKQRADLFSAEKKGVFQPSLEIQCADTKAVLEGIQKGHEKLFNVSLYINVKAQTQDELDLQTKIIQSHLNSILIIPKVPRFQMARGLKSALPFAANELGIRRNITTKALSAFFPFTSPFLILEKGGVFLALNKNKLPIIKDIFALSNANGAILATSGSGKSYAAKLIISRYLMSGTKVIVIDPQSEYAKLAEKYGGSVISISRDSNTMINPLDLLDHTYAEKRLALIDMFRVMFGELSEIQKAILDRAISKTYDRRGISEQLYKDKAPPILGDLYAELERMSKEASVYERTTYVALLNRLRMYVDGVFSFLNRQTKIKVDNNFVVFNIGHMPKQVKPVMMFLILEFVYSKMKQGWERKLLVIDEAWSMLQNAGEEGYVFEVVKTCRKFNLGLLLITQDVADLLGSKAGRAVLANSSYTILLRQKPAIINSVEEVFNLSFAEREHLLTANVGEGIIMMENDHQEIKVIASNEEHNLITTKPEEIVAAQANIPAGTPVEKRKVLIELDLTKGYYKKSERSPEEIDFLLKNDYEESTHVPMDSRKAAVYLVKKVGWHSKEHTFVLHAAKDETQRYTSEVFVDETARTDGINPDLRFKKPNREEWAVEVETGSNLRHHPDYLDKKVAKLNTLYPNRWRWLLTSNDKRRQYETRYGVPVLLRHNYPHWVKYHFRQGSGQVDNGATAGHARNIDDKPESEWPTKTLHGLAEQGVKP